MPDDLPDSSQDPQAGVGEPDEEEEDGESFHARSKSVDAVPPAPGGNAGGDEDEDEAGKDVPPGPRGAFSPVSFSFPSSSSPSLSVIVRGLI
jgi:hypothetical protein